MDETKLYVSFPLRAQGTVINNLNQDLQRICNWCFDNLLLLNPDKTKLLVLGTRPMASRVQDFHLTLLGKKVTPSTVAKDLGVTLDSNLSFDEHILSTVSSCMSRLGQINRVKHAFERPILEIIINALVFSKLFYCSSVWSNTTESNLCKLQAVQNFAACIITHTRKYEHITPVLKGLRWLPVNLHRVRN